MPLTRRDQLRAGSYLILRDYALGKFPPTFSDQAAAYEAEIAAAEGLPGVGPEELADMEMRKPFWFSGKDYLPRFSALVRSLRLLGIAPPARLLELGCGSGWMAEFLATMHFRVTATTISPQDVALGNRRVRSLAEKGLATELEFLQCPMEQILRGIGQRPPYDAVYVYEALHHAFSWREAVVASYECLKPGGWLLICEEPNVLHTFVSYRLSRLANTHEIGFSRSELVRHLRATGFRPVKVLRNRVGLLVRPHWIAARK